MKYLADFYKFKIKNVHKTIVHYRNMDNFTYLVHKNIINDILKIIMN